MRDLCPEAERRLVMYTPDGEEEQTQLPLEHPRLFDFDSAFPRVDEDA